MMPQQLFAMIEFFAYDTVKILVLLFLMVFVMGFIRTYIPPSRVKRIIAKARFGTGNLIASLFGAITPFCSCSSIPIFISFLEAGVPLGIAFSFLVTSPLVNEYLVVIMLATFGWKITAAYVISGIALGVLSGLIIGRMKMERYVAKDLVSSEKRIKCNSLMIRVRFGFNEASSITKKIWIWVVVGVGIGAIIHNYVPQGILEVIGKAGYAVPLAVLLGVPMYGSCVAIVPIALALFQKGIPLGTALAFMMATAALSLPEAIILRRAMKLKLILVFFLIVAIGIMFTGYVFNYLQALFV